MKRAFTFVEILVVVAILFILASVLYPVFYRASWSERTSSCLSNLKQIGLGMQQYLQDYDEKIMPNGRSVRNEEFGWAGELWPYLKTAQVYQCPSGAEPKATRQPRENGYTDYWLNARLVGKNVGKLKQAAAVIAFGDGNDGLDVADARYVRESLPNVWLNDSNSPAYRHMGYACYLFLDGHAKRYKPQWIETGVSGPSFAPR
jgi:prepilin-type N-terminal cleavage/methylation domain-containing protein/prepilin-type processing-associated H-X9-DG protein